MNRGVLLIGIFAVGGCAIIDDTNATRPTKMVTGIEKVAPAEQVLVTAARLYPQSDVAILPSEIEHVLWRRSGKVIRVGEADNTSQVKKASQEEQPSSDPERVQWPLLERDMDFDSQISLLEMCPADNSGCGNTDCWKSLEPCENSEAFECFETKQGNYCIERELR